MSTPEYVKYFYLRKIDEVRGRATTGDYYDLIMASGLLRHLLFEAAPLMHLANRDLQLKLTFTICKTMPLPAEIPKPVMFYPGLDPSAWPEWPTETVNLNQLLAAFCITVKGEDFTVQDILESCAHARGGIHMRQPKERDELLFGLDAALNLFGHQMTSLALRDIIRVIDGGLEPLTEAVAAQLGIKKRES
jgi:hypothetical protein